MYKETTENPGQKTRKKWESSHPSATAAAAAAAAIVIVRP